MYAAVIRSHQRFVALRVRWAWRQKIEWNRNH